MLVDGQGLHGVMNPTEFYAWPSAFRDIYDSLDDMDINVKICIPSRHQDIKACGHTSGHNVMQVDLEKLKS